MSGNLVLDLDDYVRITNNSREEIEGRYDGFDYKWGPGDALDLKKTVATHIFGWVDPDAKLTPEIAKEVRERALLRLGWIDAPHNRTLKDGLEKLKLIKIEPVTYANVRVLHPTDDPNRAPSIEILPPEENSAYDGASAEQGGAGAGVPQPRHFGPEDPQANMPTRIVPELRPTLKLPEKTKAGK
jgi:hypothetical protein